MAFGNLKFDTLTTSDAKNTNTEKSLDTSYIFNGVAKAWINLNGAGTVADGPRDSFNTGSLTDNATGDYTIAYSNTMANVNYATVSSVLDTSTNAMAQLAGAGDFSNGTSSFRTANVRNTGNSSVDPEHLMLAMHGDLA